MMPIFSYLAMPKNGDKEALCTELGALPHCQAYPADNHDLVVLVTDTPDEATEEVLQETLNKLHSLHSLQSLSLAFGYDEQ